MTNAEIDNAATAIIDLLRIGSMYYPPLALASPLVAMFVKFEAHKLKVGLADGSIVPDGQGGLVTKAWADDPRHALNRDGTFKQ